MWKWNDVVGCDVHAGGSGGTGSHVLGAVLPLAPTVLTCRTESPVVEELRAAVMTRPPRPDVGFFGIPQTGP
jgi:hypothetical protein